MTAAASKAGVLLALALVGVACGPPSLDRALPTRPGVNVLIITFAARLRQLRLIDVAAVDL